MNRTTVEGDLLRKRPLPKVSRLLIWFPARSLVAAFTIANGGIVAIDIIADLDKLRGLPLGLIASTEGG